MLVKIIFLNEKRYLITAKGKKIVEHLLEIEKILKEK